MVVVRWLSKPDLEDQRIPFFASSRKPNCSFFPPKAESWSWFFLGWSREHRRLVHLGHSVIVVRYILDRTSKQETQGARPDNKKGQIVKVFSDIAP
ncbi:hypothetical protein LR48_Vigan10g250500 [Vigna angularis]|uniref:Uncharacterized protein n=1 Tax=Phaseolus angularis TaxID=3914 RepID=A0A0L9VNT6_PHAAN|nr:hypothetical protein LR48_Vigan10g250500 [Vigna angularis]